MRSKLSWAALGTPLVLALSLGCSPESARLGSPRFVEAPAAAGSQAPNLAVGLDGKLYLSWIEPDGEAHALRFATWQGESWSAAKTIARGDDWFVNWADFPSMAALEDGTLAAHWLVKSGQDTYAYDVVLALSFDGGRNWTEPARPHDDGTMTEHGFVSLVATPEGRFDLLWLDGRNTGTTPRGAMTLRYAELDRDGELHHGAVVDDRVCDCCSTDAIRSPEDMTLVAYRDRSADEIRDISIARRNGPGWSAPELLHADRWEIAGCPVNGPALAKHGSTVAVAWFSAAGDQPAVKVAHSRDGGVSFDAPVRIDHGAPLGRVDVVVLDDGSALVSGLEKAGDKVEIRLWRAGGSDRLETLRVATTDGARSSGFPRMAYIGNRVFLAWTETGESTAIRTAVVEIR